MYITKIKTPTGIKKVGGWTDLLRTQLKEFKPVYVIPDYSCGGFDSK
ncbi:hypothetical protein HYU93_03690 [Candidatus Daviesbacteria bacterium]|nr:hypothetical protein [Candidatus Daviesbacteria bacterium]